VFASALMVGEAFAAEDGRTLKNQVPPSPSSIDAGRAIYNKYCKFCHGDAGKGDGPMAPQGSHPANLTTGNFKHGSTDGDLFATISDGVAPKYDMAGFKRKLKEPDIWNVVNYVRSLGPQGSR
jgi:mono/diheme cytochrome c family protein